MAWVAAFLSVCVLMSALLILPADATVEGSEKRSWIDILFRTEYFYGDMYRYSIDIEYSTLILTYQWTSVLIDNETGDRVIEEGDWLVERTPLDHVAVTVTNRADSPLSLEALLFDEEFDACGTTARATFDTSALDAVRYDEIGAPVVGSALMRLAVEGDPIYEKFMGKKHLGVTVAVCPCSGSATSGRDYVSPFAT
jgi:hypothetical protein